MFPKTTPISGCSTKGEKATGNNYSKINTFLTPRGGFMQHWESYYYVLVGNVHNYQNK